MKWLVTLSAMALAASASPGFAADELDIAITGVIEPASCAMTIGNGGRFDYGEIDPSSVPPGTGLRSIGTIETPLSVECNAPMRWALTLTDHRKESSDVGFATTFGLGVTARDGKNIGEYSIDLVGPSADGDPVVLIRSSNSGRTWSKAIAGPEAISYGTVMSGYALAGAETLGPKTMQSFTGTMRLNGWLNGSRALDLSEEIALDGASTLQIYLL